MLKTIVVFKKQEPFLVRVVKSLPDPLKEIFIGVYYSRRFLRRVGRRIK